MAYLKILGAACFSLLIFAQLSNIGSTISYFSDLEISAGNYLRADPLYFSVDASTTLPIVLGAGDVLVVPTMTPGEFSDPVQYQVTATTTAGDPALCNAIEVLTTAPFPYDGPLTGLVTATTTDTGPWALTMSLPAGFAPVASSSCSIDLIYAGWNDGAPFGSGYSDTERVSLTFVLPAAAAGAPAPVDASSTPAVILPDVATTDSTSSPQVDATSTDANTTPAVVPPIDTGQSTTTADVIPPADTPTPTPAQ